MDKDSKARELVELENAWNWREKAGFFNQDTLRVFHGPGESRGELKRFTIDFFKGHCWIAERVDSHEKEHSFIYEAIKEFLINKDVKSAVIIKKTKPGFTQGAAPFLGDPPQKFFITENQIQYEIRFLKVNHPGLFLDHEPLREWIGRHCRGLRVLNTFSFTGSLGLVAALGGARQVVNIDLSASALEWSKRNWELNGFSFTHVQWIHEDVLVVLPQFKKESQFFDCIILDPPTFSHGKKKEFSTERDMGKLHELAVNVLSPGGFLISCVNSMSVSEEKFFKELLGLKKSSDLQILKKIEQPETFPSFCEQKLDRYLKGYVLRKFRF